MFALPRAFAGFLYRFGFGHQQVFLAGASSGGLMCQNRFSDLFFLHQYEFVFAFKSVRGEIFLDVVDAFLSVSFLRMTGQYRQCMGRQSVAAILRADQTVFGEPRKRLGQFGCGRSGLLRQVDRSDDLDQFCRAALGSMRQGQQEDCINIVDWVHRITFE